VQASETRTHMEACPGPNVSSVNHHEMKLSKGISAISHHFKRYMMFKVKKIDKLKNRFRQKVSHLVNA